LQTPSRVPAFVLNASFQALLSLSLISMMYSVSGDPPSLAGTFHLRLQKSTPQSMGVGLSGLLGGSKGFLAIIDSSPSRSGDSPSLFTALTLNLYSLPSLRGFTVCSQVVDVPAGSHWPVRGSSFSIS